ncbi:hypothetical protein R2R70_18585 [Cobetia sp. SIMBA_158]|uniref:hypothetical protein n=1 Tax=Cobetia sp. SIMBA_158 TaxID=3081617 RepID=UPI00397F549E
MSNPTQRKVKKTPNPILVWSGVFLLVGAFWHHFANTDPTPSRILAVLGIVIMYIGFHAKPGKTPDEASTANQENAPETPPAAGTGTDTDTKAGPGSATTNDGSTLKDKEAIKETIELRCNCIIAGQVIAAMILAMGLSSNSNNMYNTIVLVIVSGFGYLGLSLVGNGYLISKSHIHYAYAIIGVLGYFATPFVFMLG